MTNIYILAVGGTPPSPWTRQTAYDTRYVKFTGTPAGHGTTGGAYSHTHTVSNATIATTPSYTISHEWYSNVGWIGPHTHAVTNASFGAVNNLPYYYQMALWYMDYTVWEATERRFPAGAILLSNTTISSDQLTRHTASEGRLIRLGDPGNPGGSGTHTHSYTFSGGSTQAKMVVTSPGLDQILDTYQPIGDTYTMNLMQLIHDHPAATIYTSTGTLVPYNIATRLYQATSQTIRADAGVICFVDGTPSANWTVLTGWSGYFAASANQNAAGSGTSTHDHTLSGNTAGYALDPYYAWHQVWNQYHPYTTPPLLGESQNHYHNFSATVATGNHEPAYVYLAPMILNNTLYHVNVYTLAETDTVRIKKVQTVAYNPDMLSKKAQTLADPMKMLLQKFDIETTADLDARLLVQYDLDLDDVTSRLKKPTDIGISASAIIAILSNAWEMTMRLVRYWNPAGKPILDSMMKGWIKEIQTVDNKIQVMYLNSSLDYAIGSDLDTKWGEVYELPRLASETDDEYRKRIKTYVTMQTGSGTKATLEAVLDTIVEEVGASRVETYVPGKIKVFFDTGESLHHASIHKDLIDYVLPQALSVGVSYELYLTFVDYLLDVYLKGFKNISYDMDHLEQYAGLERELYMYTTALDQIEVTYDMDGSCKTTLEKLLYILTCIRNTFSKTYTISVRAKQALERLLTLAIYVLNRNVEVAYDGTTAIMKNNNRILALDALALKTRDAIYIASVSLI